MSASSSESVSVSNQQQPQQPKAEDGGLTLPDDIPREIWTEIGKRLVSRLDVSRFRSVCRTWRLRLPPPFRFPLRVPRPPGPTKRHRRRVSYFITESTFYAVESELIVLFEEDYRGGRFSASALVQRNQFPNNKEFKAELPPISQTCNLSFLSNAYHLHNAKEKDNKLQFYANEDVLKIAIICSDVSPATFNPNYPRLRHLKLVAHLTNKKLAVLSLSGGAMNNHWETGFCNNTSFEDIVNYRGQLYGVDHSGRAFVMDYASLHMTQVAAPLPPDSEIFLKLQGLQGNRKAWKFMHLAVVSADLYMFISEPYNLFTPRLYKLSSRLGQWLEADQDFPPDQVFVQDVRCNFPVAKHLLTCRNKYALVKYEVPRFCSWPHFDFFRVAVGFKNEIDMRIYSRRLCDAPFLPYPTGKVLH